MAMFHFGDLLYFQPHIKHTFYALFEQFLHLALYFRLNKLIVPQSWLLNSILLSAKNAICLLKKPLKR